jgi:hypothetical protein
MNQDRSNRVELIHEICPLSKALTCAWNDLIADAKPEHDHWILPGMFGLEPDIANIELFNKISA